MTQRRIFLTIVPVLFLSLAFEWGCGGPDPVVPQDKLVGQWVAEKLGPRGDRLLLTLASEADVRQTTFNAIPLSGEAYPITSGSYSIDGNKLVFKLTELKSFSSPYTVSENRLILGTEAYDRVTGPLEGSQIGGQVRISEEAGHRSISVKSQPDFVPGEIVVKYRDGTFGKMVLKPDESRPSSLSLSEEFDSVDLAERGFRLMERQVGVRDRLIEATLKKIEGLKGESASSVGALKTSGGISQEKEVEWAVPNAILRTQSIPSDPHYPEQWSLPLLGMIDTWTQVTAPSPVQSVVVAVIDTGIVTHPDLEGRILPDGWDFTSRKGYDPDTKKIIDNLDMDDPPGPDNNPTDPGDRRNMGFSGSESSWHGSHLAGIIAAKTNNKIGIAGLVTDSVKVLPIRAMGYKGIGTLYDVTQAVLYAAQLPNIADCKFTTSEEGGLTLYTVEKGTCKSGSRPKADVINLSLAGGMSAEAAKPLADAIAAASSKGVVIVAAAGNEHRRATEARPVYPASDPNVISVGAVCPNLAFAKSYSNFGDRQFLVAPGGCGSSDILGTIDTGVQGGYGALHGTSQAAAAVSGIAAMVIGEFKARSASFRPYDVRKILQETAIDLGDSGWDEYYGYGLVNACGAVVKAKGGAATGAAALRLSSEFVDLGRLGSTHTVIASSGCGGAGVTGVSATRKTDDGADWLEVSASGTTAPSRVVLKVKRAGLKPGEYRGGVTISSSGGSKTVQVKMSVDSNGGSSDIDDLLREVEGFLSKRPAADSGLVYKNEINVGEVRIELIDPTTRASKGYLTTDFQADYYFQFVRVPPGSYGLQAGIDENRDGKICQTGEDEPCLVYGTRSNPTVIVVTASTKKNDLVLDY